VIGGSPFFTSRLNRVVDPCSKLAFADWWATTAGDRWLRVPAGALDHRRFWEAMDAISEDDLKEIERRIVAQMVETFAIDLSGLVLDMTNFATWTGSGNPRAPIAQRCCPPRSMRMAATLAMGRESGARPTIETTKVMVG